MDEMSLMVVKWCGISVAITMSAVFVIVGFNLVWQIIRDNKWMK